MYAFLFQELNLMIKIRKTSKINFFSKKNKLNTNNSLVNVETSDKFKESLNILKEEIIKDFYKRFPLVGNIKKDNKTQKELDKILKDISYFLPLSSKELADISASSKLKHSVIHKEILKGKNSVILNRLYIDQKLNKEKYSSFNFYRLTSVINNIDVDNNYKYNLIKNIKNEQSKFMKGNILPSLKKYVVEYKIDNGPLLTETIESYIYDYNEFESYILKKAENN